MLQQAAVALARGDLEAAEQACRRALENDSACVDALHLLSLAHKRRGDIHAASNLMQRALGFDPRRADIHANLANLHAALKHASDAEKHYRLALDADHRFRPARLGLARLLLDLGRAGEAAAELETLMQANPADAEAWNVAGSTYRQQGRTDAAEQAFRRALSLAPGYAVARHNLGALLASQSRSEAALEELERAAAAGIKGAEISHNRAAVLMSLGRLDEAEALLRDALGQVPRAVSLQMLLARIRYMRGERDFASVLESAVAAEPGDAALRVAFSRTLGGAEQFERAAGSLREGLDREPGEPLLLAEMSAVLHNQSAYAQALQFASRAVAARPDDPGLNDLVIKALLSLGEGNEAMALIENARQRRPLDQFYIALEATAARLIGDPRYERLCDYQRLVQRFELPVPRGWSTLEVFHHDLVDVLKERHRFVAPPLDQSLRGGTQTPRGLLNDPDPRIKAFLAAIRVPIAAFRDSIGDDRAHPLTARNHGEVRLSGCWSVRLHRDGFHVNHVHSEGWISSAYYVDVPRETRDLRAKSGWIKFGEPGFYVPGAVPEKYVQPEPGMLVLFPSYLWHGTTPIHGEEPRMTIAFDAVPARH